MTALPSTGIQAVDRELERRAPFPSPEAAEVAAARLLAIWRMLQPLDGLDAPDRKQR